MQKTDSKIIQMITVLVTWEKNFVFTIILLEFSFPTNLMAQSEGWQRRWPWIWHSFMASCWEKKFFFVENWTFYPKFDDGSHCGVCCGFGIADGVVPAGEQLPVEHVLLRLAAGQFAQPGVQGYPVFEIFEIIFCKLHNWRRYGVLKIGQKVLIAPKTLFILLTNQPNRQ